MFQHKKNYTVYQQHAPCVAKCLHSAIKGINIHMHIINVFTHTSFMYYKQISDSDMERKKAREKKDHYGFENLPMQYTENVFSIKN